MIKKLLHYNQLILLVGLFCLPVVGAWYCLYMIPREQLQLINRGELRQWSKAVIPIVNDGLWKIIYFKPQICDQSCSEVTDSLPKLQVALGVDQDRISIMHHSEYQQDHESGAMSIFDPQGIEVLYYAPGFELRNVLLDIKRLLKYSHAHKN